MLIVLFLRGITLLVVVSILFVCVSFVYSICCFLFGGFDFVVFDFFCLIVLL